MRKVFLSILLWAFSQPLSAQYTITSKGMLHGTGKNSVIDSSRALAAFNTDTIKLKAFVAELLQRVESAINNIDDDSLALRKQYSILFCDNICLFYNEMLEVRNCLRRVPFDSNCININWHYFPGRQLRLWLRTSRLFSIVPDIPAHNYKVYAINAMNDFISSLYRDASYSNIQTWDMSMAYKNGWRELEYYYNKNNYFIDKYGKNPGISCEGQTDLDNFLHAIRLIMADSCKDPIIDPVICENPKTSAQKLAMLFHYIRSGELNKWLWFTSGTVTMNPLGVTTANRRYPPTEKFIALDTASVNAARRADSDSALNAFFTTKKLWNNIQLPNDASCKKHKWQIEYYDDMAGSYNGKQKFPSLLTKHDSVGVWVYNVLSKTSLQITPTVKGIPDEGKVITELNNALGSFPSISSFVVSPALQGLLQNASASVRSTVPLPPSKDPNKSKFTAFKFTRPADRQEFAFDGGIPEEVSEEADLIIINNQKIVFKKGDNQPQDKRNIIRAFYTLQNDSCLVCRDSIELYIIDSFVVKDYCHQFDYIKLNVEKSARDLITRFNTFLKCVKDCMAKNNAKMDTLRFAKTWLTAYMSIPNRSLPPDLAILNNQSDENPVYSTIIYKSSISDSSTDQTISISKTAKVNNKDTTTVLKVLKYKTGKLHYIEASAGLAFTATDYSVYEAQASGLPVTKTGDKLQLNAGIHIYPAGLIRVDDRLFPQKPVNGLHRTSIYLGLSISSKPLDNIYTGLSYDIIPGIRAIGGAHWYKNTRYKIVNNQVFDQADGYKPTLFFSLNVDPLTLTKALGILK